jgi:hypothetical protein
MELPEINERRSLELHALSRNPAVEALRMLCTVPFVSYQSPQRSGPKSSFSKLPVCVRV